MPLGALKLLVSRHSALLSPLTLTLTLSHRGFFAQLDIGAVTRPNRRLVPVCPTPLDSRLRGNDVSCAKHPSREREILSAALGGFYSSAPYFFAFISQDAFSGRLDACTGMYLSHHIAQFFGDFLGRFFGEGLGGEFFCVAQFTAIQC